MRSVKGKASSKLPVLGWPVFSVVVLLLLASCSSGHSSGDDVRGVSGSQTCSGFCADVPTALTVAEVGKIIAQAVHEAGAQQRPATIAVVDRSGNVLGVYRMTASTAKVRVGLPAGTETVSGGLEGISLVPSELSAIAKAVTGAYLSSEGNAFTTRTASQIVQANFNPGERNQPSGPLFGVQFSQLPCSDLVTRFVAGGGPGPGPQRSPLGLSADPGGLPLYKNGTVVGGIGVEADGFYTVDIDPFDKDHDIDELIAVAGSFGFAAPPARRADRITLDGKTARFSDVGFDDLASDPATAPTFTSLTGGGLIPVKGYTENPAALAAGLPFGTNNSGFAAATDPAFAARDAFLLVDALGNNRYPPVAGTALSVAEVRQLLLSALDIANRARAQIRRPLGSPMRATVSVVDINGDILGIVRSRDAPVFGIDVSLQKARTAALFSAGEPVFAALEDASKFPPAGYLVPGSNTPAELRQQPIGDYVAALRSMVAGFTGGSPIAFANRSIGNLARPNFPDGIDSASPGLLSKPRGEWSPFSTGLQLDLGYNAVVRHVAFTAGLAVPDVPAACGGVSPLSEGLIDRSVSKLAANGIQIFPGSVPIYRGSTLVGAMGVSGDGVDQDDMVAFLGVHNAGLALNGAIGNAPAARRADQLEVDGVHLRYIQCPQAPFLDSKEQAPCANK